MNRRILVVDDESDVRDLMVNVLDDAGYETEQLSGAIDIIEQAVRFNPALIVLDITMPVVDGLEALRLLKSDPRTEAIPVIIASAQARREIMIKSRDRGAADFVVKPWDEGEVEWRVAQILGPTSEEREA